MADNSSEYRQGSTLHSSSSRSSHQEVPLIVKKQLHRWHLGLMLLVVVITLWVASGFLVNDIFENGDYRKPYFVTYLNTCSFVVYLIPTGIKYLKRYLRKRRSAFKYSSDLSTGASALEDDNNSDDYEELLEDDVESLFGGSDTQPVNLTSLERHGSMHSYVRGTLNMHLTLRETALLGLEFCFLWFLANVFSNAALSFTSVGSANLLSCTSSFFTLILGSLLKVEKFTFLKLTALLISITGVLILSNTDTTGEDPSNKGPDNQLLGNAMALASACLYGVYTTMLKVRVGDESRIDTFMFFGFVGLFNLIIVLPIIILFNFIGIETFEWPPTSRIWIIVLANCVCTLISDICWVFSMLMTTPLVVTVGLSATIPLAIVGDMILNDKHFSLIYYVGAGFVILSFFLINNEDESEMVDQQQQRED